MALTLTKQERLTSKTYISKLFEKGNPVVKGFPFRFTWCFAGDELPYPASVLFLVSKRKFSRAVDRNRIKRQMRELYRLNKRELYVPLEALSRKIILSVAFVGDDMKQMQELRPVFEKTFKKLVHEIEKVA